MIEWWYRAPSRWRYHSNNRLGGTILITKCRKRVADSCDCRVRPSLTNPLSEINIKNGGFERLIEYRETI